MTSIVCRARENILDSRHWMSLLITTAMRDCRVPMELRSSYTRFIACRFLSSYLLVNRHDFLLCSVRWMPGRVFHMKNSSHWCPWRFIHAICYIIQTKKWSLKGCACPVLEIKYVSCLFASVVSVVVLILFSCCATSLWSRDCGLNLGLKFLPLLLL